MRKPLHIFVPHCSDVLTDHLPHGDGLIAHGFITNLARRGHRLHVAAQRVEVREPLPENVTVHEIPLRGGGPLFSRLDYMLRVRRLLNTLKKDCRFDLIHQLNPVFTGMSLSLVGCGLPLVLGTYVARWPDDPDAISSKGKWVGRALDYGRNVICEAQQRQADALLLTTSAARNRLPRPKAVSDRVFPANGAGTGLTAWGCALDIPAGNGSRGSQDNQNKILIGAHITSKSRVVQQVRRVDDPRPCEPLDSMRRSVMEISATPLLISLSDEITCHTIKTRRTRGSRAKRDAMPVMKLRGKLQTVLEKVEQPSQQEVEITKAFPPSRQPSAPPPAPAPAPNELPKTASTLPLIGLIGLGSLLTAAALQLVLTRTK